ncbi:MAG: dihydroflavonol-4-reductase [Rhodospirillaceae bacterium]|nr:dihydroflavonol-4-reductase [Rhodospirillaceae bacterium]
MTAANEILVTGGTGFVGSAVTRALVAAGRPIRVLARPGSPRRNLDGLDVDIVEGDMRDAADVDRAMAGVRFLFHVAADYRLWAPDPREILRNNLTGTRNLMEAAIRHGVERIVYTSSVATIALSPDGRPADETGRLAEADAVGAYKRSKVAAERLVQAMIAERGLPAVIVNPSTPIGPRDVKPTPTGRIIVEAASGRMPGYVDTALNLVHVDDVAEGHLAALDRGRIGELYILGGENVALADMLADIAGIVGRPPPRLKFPRRLIYPIALAAEAVARVTGREPFVTRDGLRMAKYRMVFTSAKAERELGYRARPYRDGLIDAVDWFRRAGYLK